MITSSQHLTAAPRSRAVVSPSTNGLIVALCVVNAGLLVVSGLIHLHLWQGPYRDLPGTPMDKLFIVQWVLCFVGAAALLVLRNLVAVVAAAGLMAGTFIGYLISRYHPGGLLGFYLGPNYTSTDATTTMIVEIVATGLLLVTAGLMLRAARRPRYAVPPRA